jgi:pyruvyltransferase
LIDGTKHILRRAFGRFSAKAEIPPFKPRLHGIEMFHWQLDDGRQNFGDHLSSALVTKLASTRDLFLDEVVSPRRLLAVGSIMHFAKTGDVIWGSGVNGSVNVDKHQFEQIDVRSVRGPLTKSFLEKRGIVVPEVFGDPALLTKTLLGKRFAEVEKTCDVSFVPNFADLPVMADWNNVISPLLPWAQVIKRIVASRLIISSSLHGLVIADSFGIPCVYLRVTDVENIFKYEDYSLGAGRNDFRVTTSREEALRASPLSPIHPKLDAMINAFPWDLWE